MRPQEVLIQLERIGEQFVDELDFRVRKDIVEVDVVERLLVRMVEQIDGVLRYQNV